jgi:hypothetical protein
MAVAEDAFKLLGRMADAFDNPSSTNHAMTPRYLNAIKIHRSQTVCDLIMCARD